MMPSGENTETPGPFQPPKNIVVASIETVNMLTYSAIKNSANFKALYSVWKPATSSVSASGRSKGTRLVSAKAEIRNTIKPKNCGIMNSFIYQGLSICALMMPLMSSVPASITTPTTEVPIASSYEIICADERRPPIRLYLLLEDQPASAMP